jgi:hypothetical protein
MPGTAAWRTYDPWELGFAQGEGTAKEWIGNVGVDLMNACLGNESGPTIVVGEQEVSPGACWLSGFIRQQERFDGSGPSGCPTTPCVIEVMDQIGLAAEAFRSATGCDVDAAAVLRGPDDPVSTYLPLRNDVRDRMQPAAPLVAFMDFGGSNGVRGEFDVGVTC